MTNRFGILQRIEARFGRLPGLNGLVSLDAVAAAISPIEGCGMERLTHQIHESDHINSWQQELNEAIKAGVPRAWVTRLKDVSILGNQGSVVLWEGGQKFLLRDVCYAFDSQGWNRERHPDLLRRHLPRVKKIRGSVGVISSPIANNYFHFLFDSLPRLVAFGQDSSCPVILNDEMLFQKSYYNLLGLSVKRRVSVAISSHWKPDELILPALPLPELNMLGGVAPHACDFLRQLLEHPLVNGQESSARKVWINRRSGRGYADAAAVAECLAKHGFVERFLEDLSVVEQIALFRDADVVAGIHGAGLANLVYCRPGTRVVEVLPEHWGWPFYRSLSAAVGLDYRCVSASADEPLNPAKTRLARIKFSLGDLDASLKN